MKEITKPYIARTKYILDFLVYEDGSALLLSDNNDYTTKHLIVKFDAANQNITREYLEGKCVKIESPEHSEFILLMCKANDIAIANKHTNCNYAVFYEGAMFFCDTPPNDGFEEISIPLPPKADDSDFSKEGEIVPFKNIDPDSIEEMYFNFGIGETKTSHIMSDIGGVSVGYAPQIKPEEWPVIGDKISINGSKPNPLTSDQLCFADIALEVISKVNRKGGVILTLTHDSLGVIAVSKGDWIEKPKTEAEILHEYVWDTVATYIEKESLIDAITTDLMDKYNITKKPQ